MGKLIVLDPGHVENYNKSPHNAAYAEGTRMFTLATLLKPLLEGHGYRVLLTRNKVSENPSLSARGQLAGKNGADIFLSLHTNACQTPSVGGTEVYYSVADIQKNKPFAETLSLNVSNIIGISNRGAKTRKSTMSAGQDYYGVLRAAATSGCKYAFLIENAFHTNAAETAWLLDDKNLSKLAKVIDSTIYSFLGSSGDTPILVPNVSNSTLGVGSIVTISQGAVYGGLSTAKNKSIPASQLYPKEHSVSKLQTNSGREEALLKEIVSWVPTVYLTVVSKEVPKEEWFRVRKSFDDYSTQKGAFKDYNEAVACCDNFKNEGYKVFDVNGVVVYVPKPSVTISGDPKYSLLILGKPVIPAAIMTAYIQRKNPQFNPEIAEEFIEQGDMYGIRGDIALCQSIHETGHFKYGGDVSPEQNNFAGIGAVGGGAKGATFSSIAEGVAAQLQHLWAYATTESLPSGWSLVDPRFKFVSKGCAPTWVDLSGKWAVPGYRGYNSLEDAKAAADSYGHKILKIYYEALGLMQSTPNVAPVLSDYWKDIPANHWSIEYFDRATELGIFRGKSDGVAGFSEDLAVTVQLLLNTVDYLKSE